MLKIASVSALAGGCFRLVIESSGGGRFAVEYWPAQRRLQAVAVLKSQTSLGLPDESWAHLLAIAEDSVRPVVENKPASIRLQSSSCRIARPEGVDALHLAALEAHERFLVLRSRLARTYERNIDVRTDAHTLFNELLDLAERRRSA